MSAWPARTTRFSPSRLGNGAAYIALLVVAYERYNSAWAIGLVLLADLAPAMLLGPVFGAAADRWSRRNCLIVSDVVRGAAFLGIAVVDGFAATVALALLAGAGTGLFNPSLAAVPSLVKPGAFRPRPRCSARSRTSASSPAPRWRAGAPVRWPRGDPLFANAATFALSALY